MRNLGAALLLYLGLASAALAQSAVVVPATTNTIPIAGTVATSTRIVTGTAGKSIYVTSVALAPVSTSVVTFTAGTGTNCGTNTTSLTGAMTFAGQGFAVGSGYGAIWALPSGYDLCVTIATAAAPGSLAYSKF